MGKASITIKKLLVGSFTSNRKFALPRNKKKILRITSILVLASKKASSKNQTLSRLFYSKKLAETIP